MVPVLLTFLLIAQEGFGGVPATDASAESASTEAESTEDGETLPTFAAGCRTQLPNGRWASCAEALSLMPNVTPGSRSSGASKEAQLPGGQGAQALDPIGYPKLNVTSVEPDFSTPAKIPSGPWADALSRFSVEPAPSALGELRKQATILDRREAWFREEVKAGRAAEPEHERARLLAATQQSILTDVEVIALRRRQACVDRFPEDDLQDHQRLPNERVPVGIRLTLKDPIVRILMGISDPRQCNREVLVDQAIIDRVRQFHDLERRLATETFGYERTRERITLEQERTVLLNELKGRRAFLGFQPVTGSQSGLAKFGATPIVPIKLPERP